MTKLVEPSPKRKIRILPRAKPLPPDTNIRRHPLSAHFANMSTRELKALEYDIERNGVRNPITIYEDMIVDGWHRWTCCRSLGIPCPTSDIVGSDSGIKDWVFSLNSVRRQARFSQLAAQRIIAFPRKKPQTIAKELGCSADVVSKLRVLSTDGLRTVASGTSLASVQRMEFAPRCVVVGCRNKAGIRERGGRNVVPTFRHHCNSCKKKVEVAHAQCFPFSLTQLRRLLRAFFGDQDFAIYVTGDRKNLRLHRKGEDWTVPVYSKGVFPEVPWEIMKNAKPGPGDLPGHGKQGGRS